jgi:hypothetical protein
MASNSQLKYGARLINSYLGNNSTISCCEVLNTLIFPAHEQHHNNSFLCAALIMGQSNIAAGATIGSNHNSRGADGEIIAGRGFWPGLCVSLKHNSQFASYTMISKGDYPAELNIHIPFCLITNEVSKDQLVVMPGYWFMYNMYAIARNTWKYQDRDKRVDKIQHIEYEFLAPDTVNELFKSLTYLEKVVGKAYLLKEELLTDQTTDNVLVKTGKHLLENEVSVVESLEIVANDFENTKRKTIIIKAAKAYHLFKELIVYYGSTQLIKLLQNHSFKTIEDAAHIISPKIKRKEWINVGGQLLLKDDVERLKASVKDGKINGWDAVHHWYAEQGTQYGEKKLKHALASLSEISKIDLKNLDNSLLNHLIDNTLKTKEWITRNIYESRAKDYKSPYRAMVYNNVKEMEMVVGRLEDNSFINEQVVELESFKKEMIALKKRFEIGVAVV